MQVFRRISPPTATSNQWMETVSSPRPIHQTLVLENDTFPTPFALCANSHTSYRTRKNDPLYPIGQYYFYMLKINPRSIWPASHTRVIHSPIGGGVAEGGGTAAATLTFNLENCPLPLIYFHYCQLFSRRRRSLQEPAILCHIIGEETFLAEMSYKKNCTFCLA